MKYQKRSYGYYVFNGSHNIKSKVRDLKTLKALCKENSAYALALRDGDNELYRTLREISEDCADKKLNYCITSLCLDLLEGLDWREALERGDHLFDLLPEQKARLATALFTLSNKCQLVVVPATEVRSLKEVLIVGGCSKSIIEQLG